MPSIIVIAGSAGSFDPICEILSGLPAVCSAAIFIVMHIGPHPSVLPSLFARTTPLPVAFGQDGQVIEPAHVYVAPPDRHMTVEPGRIRLSGGPKVHHTRPAADPLFTSAAQVYTDDVMGVILSGGDGDGASGLKSIKAHGGRALVQRPDQARQPSMPMEAILADHPDWVLSVSDIATIVQAACL